MPICIVMIQRYDSSPRLVKILTVGDNFTDALAGVRVEFAAIECPTHRSATIKLDYCPNTWPLPVVETAVCRSEDKDYEGNVGVTSCGQTCQNWALDSPHDHNYNDVGDHSFCRNPDGEAASWCYTTDPNTRWDWCDVCGGTTNCTFRLPDSEESAVACDLCLGSAVPSNGDVACPAIPGNNESSWSEIVLARDTFVSTTDAPITVCTTDATGSSTCREVVDVVQCSLLNRGRRPLPPTVCM
jgi:hypothetical protein